MYCTRCAAFYERHPLQGRHHQLDSHVYMAEVECAFPDGVFTPENWNCQTMLALRDKAERDTRGFRAWNDDVSLGVLPLSPELPEGAQHGYLVMSWYKSHGKTGQAIVLDEGEMHPLLLVTAEAVLE